MSIEKEMSLREMRVELWEKYGILLNIEELDNPLQKKEVRAVKAV